MSKRSRPWTRQQRARIRERTAWAHDLERALRLELIRDLRAGFDHSKPPLETRWPAVTYGIKITLGGTNT